MNTKEIAEFAIKAVKDIKGDNLQRAEWAFSGSTEEQMKEKYGQSGKTRQEIIQRYKAHATKCDEVILWLESLKYIIP